MAPNSEGDRRRLHQLKQTILVIEDDDNLRQLVSETLEDEGYAVESASGPDEAVELARKTSFHLVVADVRMAGSTDGVGAIERIKGFQPRIRSIVMTGFASEEVPVRAARLQADDYLLKGDTWFGVAELLKVVRRTLEPKTSSPPRLLERLLALPGQLARAPVKAMLEARLPELARLRKSVFQTLFLLIRPGHLSRERALQAWQLLEPLELEYSQLENPAQIAPLSERYAKLAGALTGTGKLGFPPPSTLDERVFFRLYARIRNGALELEQLERAAGLRLSAEERKRSVDDFQLYSLLWDPTPTLAPDQLGGHSFGGYQLGETLPGVGPVRRYRAKGPGGTAVAEVVPAMPETREMLAQQRENPLFLATGELEGHLVFVVASSDGRARSLAEALPPSPLDPAVAWQLLHPLFTQVQEHHRNGNFCGLFGPSQALETSTLGYRLQDFGPGRFLWAQKDHNRLASCGLSLAHAAPELFLTSKPKLTAASDQYCLGVCWVRALLGDLSREELMLRTSGFLHRGASLLSADEVPLERLRAAVTILMAGDPAQRFPEMGRAIKAFDECF